MESHSESNVALSSFAPDESLGLGFSVSKNAESSTNPQQPQQQTEDASESGTAGGGVGTFGASTSAGSALVRERRDIARGLVKDAFRDLGIPTASCTATATNVNDLLMADEDPTTAADLADDADGDDEATAMQTDLEASTNVTAAAAAVGGLPRESADAATAVAAASSGDPSNSMQSDGAADSVVSSKGGDAKEGSILGRGERGATPKVVAASAPPPPRELGEEEAARRIQTAYRRHVTGVDNKHEKEDEQAEVEAQAEDAPRANVAAAGDKADVPKEQCASLAWEADDAATTEDEAARTIQRALKQHLSKAASSSKQKEEATGASGKESEGGNGDDKAVTNSGAEAEVANNDEGSVPAAVEEAPPAASITADGKEEETKKTAANAPSPSLATGGDLQMQPSAVLRQLSADEAARRIQAAFRKSANGNAMCPTNAKAVYLSAQKEKSAVFSPVVAAAPEGGKEKRTTTIPRSRHPVASYPPVTAAPCDDDAEATSYQQQTPPAAVPEVAKAPAATTQQPQQQTATAAAAGPKKGTAFAKASDERRLEASYDEEAPLLNNDSSVSAAEKKENPHEEAARPLPPLPRGFGRLEWIDGLFASVAAQQRHRLGPKRSAITERALLPEGGDALLGAKNGSSPSRAVATNGATTEGNSMDGDEREGLIDAAKLSDEAQHIRLFISRRFGLLSYAPSSSSEGNEGEKTMDANGLAVRRYANNAPSTVEWTLAADVVEDAAIALGNSHSTSDLSADSHAQKKTAVALGAAIRRALAVITRGKASRPAHGAQIVSPDRRVGLGVLSALLALVAQSTADAARLADLRAEGGHCRPPLTLPSQCLVVARLFCEALAAVTSVAAPTHAVERSSGQPVSRSVPCYTAVRNAFAIGDSTDGRTIDAETLRSLTSGAGSQFSPRGKEASSFVGFAAVADRLQSRFFTLPREKEQDEGEKANTSSTAAAVSRSKAIMRISCATNEVKPEESKASASALLRRRIKNECAARAALAANVETVFRRTVAPTLPPPLQVGLDRAVDSSTNTSAKAATDVVEALKGFSETAAALAATNPRGEAANAAAENTKAVVPPSPPSTGASPYTSTIGARIAARRINAGLGTKASFSPPATSAVAEQQPSPPAAAAAAPSPHSTLPCSAIPPSVGDVLKAIAAYDTTGLVGPNSLPFSSYALFSFCLCFILGHEEALGAHAPTVYKRVRAAIGRAMGGSAAASVSSFGDSFRNGIMDGTMSSYDAMGGTAAAQSAFALSTSLSPLRRRPATASTSTATATATTAAAALLGVSGQQASNTILYDSIFECFSDLVTSEAFAALLSECANGSPLWVAMSPAIVPIATFFASEKYIVPEVNTMNTSGGGAAAAENKDGSAASVGPQHCRALQRLLAALRTYLAVSSDGATLFLSPCGAVTRHRATASAAFEWITSVMRGLLVAAPQPPMLQSGADNGAEGEGMTPPFAAHPLAWLPLEAPVEKPCAQTWGLLASVVGRAVAGAAEASTHVTYMPIEESHSRVARHAAPTPLPSRRVESSSSGVIAPSPPRDYAADRRPQPQGGDYSRLQY